jgi:hypothetical protein
MLRMAQDLLKHGERLVPAYERAAESQTSCWRPAQW